MTPSSGSTRFNDDGAREHRIRAIVNELLRRWANGEPISVDETLAAYPDLKPELAEHLRPLRLLIDAASASDETVSRPARTPIGADVLASGVPDAGDLRASDVRPVEQGSEGELFAARAAQGREGEPTEAGLHIRCPHCRYQVELLAESELDQIMCSTCGSIFSLIHSTDHTEHAKPLTTIGHFELVTRLGIGSFGAVWKAHDIELDRTVAIKIPRRGQLDPITELQFLREARVAAQLRHPNIVSVYEVGREGSVLYIVSDLVRGVTLKDWLTATKPSWTEAAELTAKIAEALHHAHERGVVHRDLKPSNILIDQEVEPRITDFGLAKRDAGEVTMTVDGQILGTPAYMSPEQAAGQSHHVDRRTDVYSLGVVLFELLTGELPFRGSVQMQLNQKLHNEAPNPRSLDRLIPRDLAVICSKCLDRDPNRRYLRASDLAMELRRFLHHEPILARPIPPLERLLRWAKRKPAKAVAAALAIVLAVGGPALAIRIEFQRRRLEDLNARNLNLIADRDQRLEQAKRRLAQLQGERDALGKDLELRNRGGDSELVWPTERSSGPYRDLLQRIVERVPEPTDSLDNAESLTEEKLEAWACTRFAWGIAREQLDAEGTAKRHLESARDALCQLAGKHPENLRYAQALSDCHRRLASLASDEQGATLRAHQERQTLQRRLSDASSDPRRRAELVDAELRLAIAQGAGKSAETLRRAHRASQDLLNQLPASPTAFYELVCHLCGTAPVLTDADER